MKLMPVILSSLIFLGTPKDIDSLGSKYGVEIVHDWSGYTITSAVHDSYAQVAKLPLSTTPQEMDKMLEKIREQKLLLLEKDFAVHIARSGKISESAYDQAEPKAPAVAVRAPKLGELFVLEYALTHSKPGQLAGLSRKSRGVNIYFLKEKNYLTSSEWGFDNKGRPSIFIEPRGSITIGHTLEENLMHQLSHNSEFRMGWNPNQTWEWPLVKKLGWALGGGPPAKAVFLVGQFGNSAPGPMEMLGGNPVVPAAWLIKTSEGPNFLYRQSKPDLWTRCDMKLHPLDDAGNPVAAAFARKLSSERIRDYALVKPVSDDFPTPPEVMADGIAMFRADRNARAELRDESPRLYKIVKEFDQKELDATYGRGQKVRAVDGTVSDPTPDVLKEIRELEQGTPS